MDVSDKNVNSNLRKYVFVAGDGEDFQVLGYAEGKDVDSAKQVLFEKNDGILSHGVLASEIQAYEFIERQKLVLTKKREKREA